MDFNRPKSFHRAIPTIILVLALRMAARQSIPTGVRERGSARGAREELLLFSILATLALLGLILPYTELRKAARARKSKKEVMSFSDRVERVRKAG